MREYIEGQFYQVITDVAYGAYHYGYVELKICPLAYESQLATQECFDKYPIEIVHNDPRIVHGDSYKFYFDRMEENWKYNFTVG